MKASKEHPTHGDLLSTPPQDDSDLFVEPRAHVDNLLDVLPVGSLEGSTKLCWTCCLLVGAHQRLAPAEASLEAAEVPLVAGTVRDRVELIVEPPAGHRSVLLRSRSRKGGEEEDNGGDEGSEAHIGLLVD